MLKIKKLFKITYWNKLKVNCASSWFSFTIAPEVCMRLFRISTERTDISISTLPSSGNYPGPVLLYKMLWKLDFNSFLHRTLFWLNLSPGSTPTTHIVLSILIFPSEAFHSQSVLHQSFYSSYFPYLCYTPSLCLIFTHTVQVLFSSHTIFMFMFHKKKIMKTYFPYTKDMTSALQSPRIHQIFKAILILFRATWPSHIIFLVSTKHL
jgi:hypothetical protein